MNQLPLEPDVMPRVVQALGQSPLFSQLAADVLSKVAERGSLFSVEPGETIMVEGESPSDSFFVVLAGEVAVYVKVDGEQVEITRLRPPDSIGEMGLLLDQPRSATVVTLSKAVLLKFERAAFFVMYERVPAFGLGISRALAQRLGRASHQVPVPVHDGSALEPDPEVVAMLPLDFIERHRVVPLVQNGNVLTVGFVDDPSAKVLSAVRQSLPGMDIRPLRIPAEKFSEVLTSFAGVKDWSGAEPLRIPGFGMGGADIGMNSQEGAPVSDAPTEVVPSSPRLDRLLRRMVAEGASDLHLSGGQRPRWRIDGEMHEIADAAPLSSREAHELLEPVMEDRHKKQFDEDNDVDFAYALAGVARFRVNVFRDKGGIGSVMRQIPAKILTFEQLGLPLIAKTLCEHPKGLVLVTGPTGSGKSTTLAAMIDYINKARRAHIITLEDPIEFVHESRMALINQREVGAHTKSFQRALKAALREDPDIVLVGEMRDMETVRLALETANTGHLVFGTLHTATAISTVDRIIDIFPGEQQSQIRAVLADTLKGVVAQTLCRKIGGGRIAALETLVVSYAIANLIREGKMHQVASAMMTSKAQGNTLLNETLAELVKTGKVDYDEALTKAVDKGDMARRCGKPAPNPTGAMPAPAIA